MFEVGGHFFSLLEYQSQSISESSEDATGSSGSCCQSILLKLLPQNDGPVDHWSRTKFLITHVIKQLWPHLELDLKFSVYV